MTGLWGYVSFWGSELPGHVLYSESPSSALIRAKEAGFRDSQSTGYSLRLFMFGYRISTRKLSTPRPGELSERDPFSQATGCLALFLDCRQGVEETRAQELDCRQRR